MNNVEALYVQLEELENERKEVLSMYENSELSKEELNKVLTLLEDQGKVIHNILEVYKK
jgi:hypothetical protein